MGAKNSPGKVLYLTSRSRGVKKLNPRSGPSPRVKLKIIQRGETFCNLRDYVYLFLNVLQRVFTQLTLGCFAGIEDGYNGV